MRKILGLTSMTTAALLLKSLLVEKALFQPAHYLRMFLLLRMK
jgi:hypothetical protein